LGHRVAGRQHQADALKRWKHVQVYTRADTEDILVAKLMANSAKPIDMLLAIVAVMSAAIRAASSQAHLPHSRRTDGARSR